MVDYYITTGDIGRQQTCLNTVEIIISFDILSKPIKLKKHFSPTRSCGNIKIRISTGDNKCRKKHKTY